MTGNRSAMPRRYLALWLPFLPTDRWWRTAGRLPGPDEPPLAIVDRIKSALRLVAVDRRAAVLGLAPGLTLADARARVPELKVAEIDVAADRVLLEQLADFCDRYTPLVALDGDDGLVLDITGCAHLFGGEAGLATDSLKRFAKAGIAARVGIAGTPHAARAVARFSKGGIVPPGAEPAAVAPLPVAALDIVPEVGLALTRAGLKTVGALAERPRAPLAARFGTDLPARLARVLGEEDIGITPRRPLPVCLIERRFAEPVSHEDDVIGTLAALAAEAGPLLETRGEGGRRFEAGFFRSDGKVMRLSVETVRPLRDPDLLMRLFRERLDVLDDPLEAGFGFDFIRLAVTATERFEVAQTSLDGRAIEEAEEAALVDRLAARFGKDGVFAYAPVESHIPERMARAVPAGTPVAAGWIAPEPGMPPARPIHLFDPPQPIEALAEVPDGPPLRFRWRRVLHEVAAAEGPERIAPEWWRESDALTRDYYRVEDAAGRRFWLFREGLFGEEAGHPRWYLHGVFA